HRRTEVCRYRGARREICPPLRQYESCPRREESLARFRGAAGRLRRRLTQPPHTAMDLNSLTQLKRERFEQLEREISDPRLFDNRKRAEEIMREHASLKDMLETWSAR